MTQTILTDNATENHMVAASPRGVPAQTAGTQALMQRTLAEVQCAVMMARQFPRDKIAAREKLVLDCSREGLASVATYTYGRGGSEVTGPSIRLAEAAKNAWGNLQSGWRELSRDKGPDGVGRSEVEAFAWDAENNTRESVTFFVRHWRDTKGGGYPLKDERDIKELLANQAKRVERGCILNSIDGDMIEAALAQCGTTLNTKVQATPERIAAMVASFGEMGVSKAQIEKRIQRRIDAINPPLLISLSKIYNSMKDGMSTAAEWFEPEEPADTGKPASRTDALKDRLKKGKEDGTAKPPHDPETGEVLESAAKGDEKPAHPATQAQPATPTRTLAPKAIPVGMLADDSKQVDWDSWAAQFLDHVDGAADLNALEQLKKLNAAPLSNLAKANAKMNGTVQERLTVRFVDLGGMAS